MLPYFLILFFIVFYLYFKSKYINKKKGGVFISLVMMLFFSIRHYSVGTDTVVYIENFLEYSNYGGLNYERDDDVEPMIQWISYIIGSITNNYFYFLFVCSIFVFPSYVYFFRKYSEHYIWSIFVFITYGFYTIPFNTLRSAMASAFLLIALDFLLKKRKILFIIFSGIASLAHLSVLFVIPIFFLIELRIKIIYKFILSLLISFFTARLVVSYVSSSNVRYTAYGNQANVMGGVGIVSFYFLLFLIFTFFYRNNRENYIYNFFYQFYSLGVLLMIPVLLLQTNPSGPLRMLNYFTWSICILIPILLVQIKNIYLNFVFFIFSIAFYSIILSRIGEVTPYIINSIFSNIF